MDAVWWWMLVLMLIVVIPTVWIHYWYAMFLGGLLEGIFGDRFMKSWVSRRYRETKRLTTKGIWWLCVWGAVFVIILWAAFSYFDYYYEHYM